MTRLIRVLAFGLAVIGSVSCASSGGPDDPSIETTADAAAADPQMDPLPAAGVPPGGACSCDADCASDAGHAGVCVYGVCMTKASAACATPGSQAECGAGSRCWNLQGWDGGPLCWPDCNAHTCSGVCDGDGSCIPKQDSDCDATCGSACSCSEVSCGQGSHCVAGECVPDAGSGPMAQGPGPACPSLPVRDCTGTGCTSLVTFSPRTTTAWDDYPLNGETATNQYRSYARKDLAMLVAWATSKVACKTADWTTGIGGPLGLGDMSEANGAIPGTSVGSPGHPPGTHVNGRDMDIGYYQKSTADNRLRPVCPHIVNGQDQYHCVSDPTTLDVWRNAMFLGALFESPRTRVVGVDGKVGPLMLSALDTLCDNGWLSGTACTNIVLAYETTNNGQGWFQFHHHHQHLSLKNATSLVEEPVVGDGGGEWSGGGTATGKVLTQRPSTLHRVRRLAR
ncbi:MAG: hypothetical protein AB7R00_14020 [Kofleriaceae bacterium]